MRDADVPGISLGQALALGALHGPAELLPISSSGHVALFPWLARWDSAGIDADVQKAFEVALHAGTALALVIGLRDEVSDAVRALDRPGIVRGVLSAAPAAFAGYVFEGPIERRLGTPATIAAGLAVGGIAIALADRTAQRRTFEEADARDALALGIAQACALVPGVSRGGATLAMARARGFTRPDSHLLSRHAALPVIVGATSLKSLRLWQRGIPPRTRTALAVGAAASFATTLASARLIRAVERDRPLLPFAAYRLGLAGVVARRLVRGR